MQHEYIFAESYHTGGGGDECVRVWISVCLCLNRRGTTGEREAVKIDDDENEWSTGGRCVELKVHVHK